MTAAEKRDIDWEKIGKLYRLGQMSVREIARQEDIQPSSITRHAKKMGWTQDKTELIRQQTQAKLISNTRATPDATDVALAVDTNVAVIRGHRTLIGRMNRIVSMLMDQLEEAALNRDEIEKAIAEETAKDEDSKRYKAMMKAVSLPSHATSIVNLTNAGKTVVGLERQAFNIGDEPPAAADSLSALLDHIKTTGSRLPIKPQETK